MSVPIAAVDLLSENLNQLLSYNYHMVADVKENIARLTKELASMRQMMVNFAQYSSDSETMKQAVKEMRQILDNTEDAVDTYVLQASVQKSRSLLLRSYHNMTDMPMVFRDLEKQIEYMAAKVKQINKETLKRGLEVLQYQEISQLSQPGKSTQIKLAPAVEKETVVGFERATTEVAKLLITGCENLEVISIAGMSGLGKTTLSRELFKDPLVEVVYRVRAFVYLSREYSRRDVLRRLLASLTKSNEENRMSEKELENGVLEELKDKNYLVVLDDVWETEDWDMLKGVFPINEKRCRVLITTRNERVAEYANPKNPESLYRLDFLSLEKSRQLLRLRVFNDVDNIPPGLHSHEADIVRICDGLPLAIVLVAGILVNHSSREYWWEAVAGSVRDYIARASETNKLIELMYKHLPNHLKTCFLYLGVFSEDSAIPVWKLLRLWVSEGFIERGGESNMENVAEKYLEELVQRNLVIIRRRRSNGKIKSCRIHNSLLHFCKAKASEENLFQEISNSSGGLSLDMDHCRRLCINNASITDYIGGGPSGKRVRSFLTFVKDLEEERVEPQNASMIPKAFKLLRVLEAQSLIFSRIPPDLSSLVLLKYLAISSTFATLPASLSALWNLQTLIVVTTENSLDVKADIWSMPQFRHFHTKVSTCLPSPGPKKQKTSSIQTLCNIAPESCIKEAFALTPKLEKLGIYGSFSKVNDGSGLLQLLSGLESLENLKLLSNSENLAVRLHFRDLPKHLTKLTLMKTRLAWEQMSEIGQLEKLKVLKLKEFAFQGAIWTTQEGGFLSLIHLHIGNTDLVTWETRGDDFPKLEHLELNATHKLESLPRGFAEIPCLQFVVLSNTHPNVASTARNLQQLIKGNRSSSFRLSVYPPEH